jgi:hypothetical protein
VACAVVGLDIWADLSDGAEVTHVILVGPGHLEVL